MKGSTAVILLALTLTACEPPKETATAQGASKVDPMTLADPWTELPRTKSKMDDSEIISLIVGAAEPIHGWLKETTPDLIVRYKEGKFEVYVVTGMAANPELGNGFMVRTRVDERPARSERWEESTDHEGLFSPNPVSMVNRMASASRLVFEFTPYNSSPQTANFNIKGLSRHLDENFEDWKIRRKK